MRDRRTLSLYGQLSVFGYFLCGFGPSVPLLGHVAAAHCLVLEDSDAGIEAARCAGASVVDVRERAPWHNNIFAADR